MDGVSARKRVLATGISVIRLRHFGELLGFCGRRMNR